MKYSEEQRKFNTINKGWWSMFRRINGYLLIPHELLHIVGYRLTGKQCNYRWGDYYVKPIGSLTQRQKLVGLLFPFFVFLLLFGVFTLLSIVSTVLVISSSISRFWIIFWSGLAVISWLYGATSLLDLRQAYRLIFNTSPQNWTPFDLLLWPLLKPGRANNQNHELGGDDHEAK